MIRSATIDELVQVNALRKEVADLHRNARPDIFRLSPDGQRDVVMQASAMEMLTADDKDIIVCVQEDDVVGFACVDYVIREETEWAPAQRFCYVKEFGVAAHARRQGIAKQMMHYLKEQAASRGIHRLELDVWAFNEAALRLYEGLGFKTRYCYMEMDFE